MRLASTDPTREALAGLLLSASHTVATDGHCLGAIAVATDIATTEFPNVGVALPPRDCGWCLPCWTCAGAALVKYSNACAEYDAALAAIDALAPGAGPAMLPPPLPEAPALAAAPRWHACVLHRPAETLGNAAACPVELEWTLRDCILERDAALELAKLLGKKPRLPVLGRALVDVPATNANGTIRAFTTDLERTRPLEVRKVLGEFPAWEKLRQTNMGTTHAPAVGFNPKLLARVLDVAIKAGCGTLTMRTPVDALSPIVLEGTVVETGAAALFLVMPCRI